MRAQFLGVIVVAAAVLAGQVCAEEVGPKPRAAQDVKVAIACPRTTIVAGENLEFSVTVQNTSDKDVSTAPLQPFAFLTLHVESEGKVIPPQLKVQLIGLDPDVTLGAGKTLKRDLDIGTWFPLGFYAGTFEVSVKYLPDRNDRSIVVKSNVVKVEVRTRTAEQEKEYQDFVEMLRSSGAEETDKCKEFLKQHPKSFFVPRVRIEYAGGLDLKKDIDEIEQVLGEAFERASPTRPERNFARNTLVRSLEKNGRINQALSVLQDVDAHWAEVKRLTLRRQLDIAEHGPPPAEGEPENKGSKQMGMGDAASDAKSNQKPDSKAGSGDGD